MSTGTNQQDQQREQAPWWRRGVVYQVYVRSFADGNGDGTGDINGLRSRLPYLQALGVDAIWINPWYESPLADGGYDVSDYRQIEPRYGTLDDAENLIAEAHDHGIRVIADLVPNHTSEKHVWFEEARAADPGDQSRLRYHIRDGRGPDGSEPPTDWISVFGGPAWTRLADGQWYLHLFAPEQPDLNWEHPEVLAEFESVLRFWLDRGIDGFRIDVAHGLVKDTTFPDIGDADLELLAAAKKANHPFWDRDGIHEIVRQWRAVVDSYDGERMLVAEAWVDPDRLPLYLRPDEYHQSFNFEFLEAPWNAATYRKIVTTATGEAAAVGSTPTWVLANHDVMRETTRYGLPDDINWRAWPIEGPADLLNVEQGHRRARAAALLLLGLPGSTYIYQGQELGLPEAWDLPFEVLDDPVWERSGRTRKGRDGCRVPLPWEPSGPSLGFGAGEGWLPQPADWAAVSAASQTNDADSSLALYTAALRLRRQWGMTDEVVELLDLGDEVMAYRRGSGMTCIVNFGAEPIPLPEYRELLLASDANQDGTSVATDCAVWIR
ncbi:MAG: glycoside hydrolase family 13 protein [Acidimicrobiales bacterium]